MTETPGTTGDATPLPLRVRRFLGRIRRSFALDTFDVFVRPTVDDFEAPEGYVFRWATPADIAGCDAHHTELDERERREGAARLSFGHRCVAAWAGDTIVFTMWENPRNINIPGAIKRKLGPHQSFIYKAYTSPDHRGRKLYGAGMKFVLTQMAREGKTELLGYAHLKKKISRKGLATLAFRSIGRFRTLSVPGLRHTFVSRELASYLPQALPRSGVHDAAPGLVPNQT